MLKNSLSCDKFLHLEYWMEIRGKLQKISRDDFNLYLNIDKKILVFRKESAEASIIQENLNDSHIGKNISILRTDQLEKQIIIRFIQNELPK